MVIELRLPVALIFQTSALRVYQNLSAEIPCIRVHFIPRADAVLWIRGHGDRRGIADISWRGSAGRNASTRSQRERPALSAALHSFC